MPAHPGTGVLPSRRPGGPPHHLGSGPSGPSGPSGAAVGRLSPPARRSAAAPTERRTVVGDVTLAYLPVAPETPLQLAAAEGTAQAVIILSGSVALRGRRGPMVPVDRGAVAAAAGALTLDGGGPAAMLRLTLPLNVLSRRGVRLPGGVARSCADGALLAPLREFAYALHRAPPLAPLDAARAAERSLVELLVGTLLEADPPSMDSAALRGILRTRAAAIVQRRFTDPALRPRLVALELNVSLRHLQRSFEGSGTTIALEIRRARSDYAAALIDTLTGPDRSDRRIAARAGFTSAGQLRAAFDDRFGMPTSSYRMLAPTQVLPSA
ncbi:helix-turn-helix domain-containing protein [Arthrobacter agilis]|uniref:helix-turn-helix domain-containing protein n=1 Tax=Arthrobacter agilis TaxID=37921 RepID=UPI002782F25A|nr:helix-turn-helix domain-containing protein [Arthrobacter agilis]MDQ0734891.1 AraC-like DNA-binding protein [Arthrobacter agilis]